MPTCTIKCTWKASLRECIRIRSRSLDSRRRRFRSRALSVVLRLREFPPAERAPWAPLWEPAPPPPTPPAWRLPIPPLAAPTPPTPLTPLPLPHPPLTLPHRELYALPLCWDELESSSPSGTFMETTAKEDADDHRHDRRNKHNEHQRQDGHEILSQWAVVPVK